MTHIVELKYKTKKAFKEGVKMGDNPFLSDPSIINPHSGYLNELLGELEDIYVTNHPKRSWFARIRRSKKTGRIIIE